MWSTESVGTRHLCGVALAVMLSAPAYAQETPHYRQFDLGASVAAVSALTSVPVSQVRTAHARPDILVQQLQWRRPYTNNGNPVVDPVQQITFDFFNDQLFRLVIDYDRDRTEGLTDKDMIAAVTTIYGPPVAHVSAPAGEEPFGARVASWGNAEYVAVLYRLFSEAGYRLTVTSIKLSQLARAGEAQALRLDEREAPQRERAREQKATDDATAARDKARDANKKTFTP